MRRTIFLTVVMGTALAVGEQPIAHGAQYTITDLGTLGGSRSLPYAINNRGEVVGMAWTPGDATSYGFVWRDGAMTPLASWAFSSAALDINDSGQIVGVVGTGSGSWAFRYDAGTMLNLGSFGGTINQAEGINSAGEVVGHSDTTQPTFTSQPFYWHDGSIHELWPPSEAWGEALAINDRGDIVGIAASSTGYGHAFLYSNGTVRNLGTLGGLYSAANDINSSGQVVGHAGLVGDYQHAFLWDDGVMTDLGTLGGEHAHTGANAINGYGQIVGYSALSEGGPDSAFLYQNGRMLDLNDLVDSGAGWVLTAALDINDAGQIVGEGWNPDGFKHAFLLTPIPEPATLLLLTLSSFGVFGRKREADSGGVVG